MTGQRSPEMPGTVAGRQSFDLQRYELTKLQDEIFNNYTVQGISCLLCSEALASRKENQKTARSKRQQEREQGV